MADYARTEECLMQFLRHQLDDRTAERCGRCSTCRGGPVVDVTIPDAVRASALEFLHRSHLPIEPRKQWPTRTNLGKVHQCAEGRTLSAWGDPGWTESVRRGKYDGGHFGDDLVAGVVAMVHSWSPEPAPTWVTAVPSSGEHDPVDDVARRIAAGLSLPFVAAVSRIRQRPSQKTMQNSVQQFRNTLGAFQVDSALPGPVLVVDDMVDSRWTFTMIGHLLGEAGTETVFPVALVDTSQRQP
jgi:ATP-dependent DNA helicase RecQ